MISLSSRGSFDATLRYLKKVSGGDAYRVLDSYGQMGVSALSAATPRDSGETSTSWGYRVINKKTVKGVEWFNTHTHNGQNVAILIQYGHGTGNGGYVAGRDYINPTMRPIFDQMADNIWKEVTT